MQDTHKQGGLRGRLQTLVESNRFQQVITALIVINAVTLGLETSERAMAAAGGLLQTLDKLILSVFVVELTMKILVYGRRFHRDPWNLFDFLVVGIALVPATGNLSVLRALRVLRVLRLISAVPSMRRVVGALLAALPGMGSIVALLGLLYYVFAVMATKLFAASFPDWFGTIGASAYTLFQIMTLESWSMGIVRPVMETYPLAWLFFVPFILMTSFTVLNLFIGIIVDAMQAGQQAEIEAEREQAHADAETILRELRSLRQEVAELKGERGE
ncbi:ion transporter [Aquibaculum sediminis]|uniref:ion transporter n=1 Tax=Aquibaculum sediminis TaxID=3231907 RepID=UPI0034517968